MMIFAKKLDARGLRHRHSTTVNFESLACALIYQFSDVLSEKRKRDTSPKGGSQASKEAL